MKKKRETNKNLKKYNILNTTLKNQVIHNYLYTLQSLLIYILHSCNYIISKSLVFIIIINMTITRNEKSLG